jgi:hypothetical protein
MKTKSLVLGCFIAAILSTSALALTSEEPVTPAYVRGHPKEWSVEVTKGKDGLIHFTIKHDAETPQYHVAHLAVYHQGKLMATSDTPLFGKKRGNTFCFSLAAEDIAESKFELSDSALSGSHPDRIPGPGGSIIHHFRLLEFVPGRLARPATGG